MVIYGQCLISILLWGPQTYQPLSQIVIIFDALLCVCEQLLKCLGKKATTPTPSCDVDQKLDINYSSNSLVFVIF